MLNSWKFTLCYFFFSVVNLIFETKEINWKNLSLNIIKEDKNYAFGYLIYRTKENETVLTSSQHFNNTFLNRLCSFMKYDDFNSFSMYIYTNSSIKSLKLDLKRNKISEN